MNQGLLDFTPAAQPVRAIAAAPRDQAKRLKRSCAAILARLQAGPATGLELIRAGGGTRYGARVLELRGLGYRIDAVQVDRELGIWRYTLVEGE